MYHVRFKNNMNYKEKLENSSNLSGKIKIMKIRKNWIISYSVIKKKLSKHLRKFYLNLTRLLS